MAGRAMLTTVASRAAIPEPSTLTASTHLPGAEEYERPGASATVMARADSISPADMSGTSWHRNDPKRPAEPEVVGGTDQVAPGRRPPWRVLVRASLACSRLPLGPD